MNILNKLTKNYLKLNKKRTIVTIIGIILSGAMITAVATLAVSFQSFMLDAEIQADGAWEAKFSDVKTEDIGKIKQDKRFSKVMLMVPVGMAQNQYSEDEFLYIKEYDKVALENMRIRITEGRLPQNSNEIVLSKTFFDGKENEPKIGETITLPIGKRMLDTQELISQKKTEGETFVKTQEKTYTICGIIERPDFESSSAYYTSGVSLLDESKPILAKNVDIGVIDKKAKNIYKDTEEIAESLGMYSQVNGHKMYEVDYNTYVLAYKGVNSSGGFNAMLYSVCGILIVVIAIGSILVIYNSFAISVSERKKQFGMLASVGATKKQIKKSVIYEGAILGSIGIPLGILAGIGGIGITLKIVNNLLKPMFNTVASYHFTLHLVVSWPAIVIAVILIALTIYLSVIIPAKRASKITPIEAIRQSDDIKVKAKKLKTPKFMKKLFGIEGEIALKNLKRSKKRYRTTVISLIISIVLFVSVSGFVGYLYSGMDSLYETVDYDYSLSIHGDNQKEKKQQVKEKIETLSCIDKLSITEQGYFNHILPEDKLDSNMKKALETNDDLQLMLDKQDKGYHVPIKLISLNKSQYEQYLKEVGVKELKENQIILINYVDLLASAKIEGNLSSYQEKDKIEINEGIEGEEEPISRLEIIKVTNKMPFGTDNTFSPKLIAITTEQTLEKVIQEQQTSTSTYAYMTAKDEKELKAKLEEIEKNNTDLSIHVENVKEVMEQQRNLKVVIQIFLYGFIALISAIGIANIFNTISTNINLRRREFAMLKSIGMTDTSFKKMLDLECIFYGTKALLYGLPIGIAICFFINQGFANLVEFAFNLPWSSIVISIIAVYLVVFSTMIYASRKIKKENIIDVLRDENI